MKIQSLNKFRIPALVGSFLISTQFVNTQNLLLKENNKDTFEKTISVPPKGTNEESILAFAPNPEIQIKGKNYNAVIVIDISKNILYKYDETGKPQFAYLIASGKPSTPTDTGIRVITNIESYPYRTASPSTKRYKNPRDYGPKALILRKVNPKTGETSPTGEFIHGNNNPASIGTYASKGCIRMDNEVIKIISEQVKKGDYVLIQK